MGICGCVCRVIAVTVVVVGMSACGQAIEDVSLSEVKEGVLWLPSVSLDLSYYTKHIDNGYISNADGNVQSELRFGLKGFYAGVSSVFDMTGACGYDRDFSEWNYVLGYEAEFSDLPLFGSLQLGVEWLYEDYPRAAADDIQELSLSLVLTELPFAPNAVVSWDYENDVFSGSVGVAHSKALALIDERLSWDSAFDVVWGSRAWNEGEYGSRRRGASSLVINTGPVFALSENFSVGSTLVLGRALGGGVELAWREDEWNCATNAALIIWVSASF